MKFLKYFINFLYLFSYYFNKISYIRKKSKNNIEIKEFLFIKCLYIYIRIIKKHRKLILRDNNEKKINYCVF